ncbi:MAG: leucine-rich repeat domain protein [Candidatus Lokiarchaeum sp. GC14_75]|nr:MAG: leucine-rich repeat domain protein [Candidatus Lokiarchaeum sp. GC14_75]
MSNDLKVLKEISKLVGRELRKYDIEFLDENLDNSDFIYSIQDDNVIYIGLDFSNKKVSEADHQKVGNYLTNLKYLKGFSISYREIDEVPDFIRNFKDLESLNLKQNNLKSLPEWIKEFKNLSRLNLNNNDFKSLPDWMNEFKKLSYLSLEGNSIKILPEWLGTLDQLKTLKLGFRHLEWNEINLKVLKAVCRRGGIISAPRLLKFQAIHDLPNEKIKIISEFEKYNTEREKDNKRVNLIPIKMEEGKIIEWKLNGYNINSLPENFGIFHNLRALTISHNPIESLPESFGELKNLEFLDLSNNKLTLLPESFVNLVSINNLNLSKNQFGEIPTQLWALKELTNLNISDNPLNPEDMNVSQKVPDLIREYLRTKATIRIFISHAVIDYEPYRIKELIEYLEKQKEISQVFFCEEDLAGNIDKWMLDAVQKCQLILFIGTQKSVFNSPDCANELQLADKFSIPVIPLKGNDIDWPDLAQINLSRELGLEFDKENFDRFCNNLYQYILNFKREIDLIDKDSLQKGITDIYERFRLILEESLSDVKRNLDSLTKRILNLEEKVK